MEVQLKDQPYPVTIPEVETEDDNVIVGKNNSGKEFVARVDRVGEYEPSESEPLPVRHRFRVYLREQGAVLRVVDPAFEEVKAFYLADGDPDTIRVRLEEGVHVHVARDDILTVLSARPEDQAATEAAAN